MSTKIWTVDAFADAPFSGNPAGVCLLERPAPEAWMQAVAAEMNLSETAFLVPGTDGFGLRWFTPACEVELCGHATLAGAHVLWSESVLPAGEIARFHTMSGDLSASLGPDGLITLDFPAERGLETSVPGDMARALGVTPVAALKNRMDYLLELASEDEVLSLAPDMAQLKAVECRGVIVTARSEREGVDFVSRFFAPAVGIDEDPVTGSAHCFLGPFWSKKLDKSVMTAFQASRRGGTLRVETSGHRVFLGGRAVTVLSGELGEAVLA